MEEKLICCVCGCEVSQGDELYIDEDVICEECYSNRVDDDYINDYSYKPEPIFYGENNRYYGIELEVDKGGKYGDYAKMILDVANIHDEHIYIKSDSSLDDGFEIVSHPMTLEYHLNTMDW